MTPTITVEQVTVTPYFSTRELFNFLEKIEIVDNGYHTDCWIWTGGLNEKGYSQFWCHGKNQKGHRASYTHFRGDIPQDKQFDHLCQTEMCVNPWHGELVDNSENCYRKWQVIRANEELAQQVQQAKSKELCAA